MTDLILPCNVKSEGRNMLVLDNSTIKAVIDEYAKSEIQSEAEVRSKLVVPLLCALGYPSELRAEEFPVYGFGGRKKLPAKSADFLLFQIRNLERIVTTHRRTKTGCNHIVY